MPLVYGLLARDNYGGLTPPLRPPHFPGTIISLLALHLTDGTPQKGLASRDSNPGEINSRKEIEGKNMKKSELDMLERVYNVIRERERNNYDQDTLELSSYETEPLKKLIEEKFEQLGIELEDD
jgi:hypothetical protein